MDNFEFELSKMFLVIFSAEEIELFFEFAGLPLCKKLLKLFFLFLDLKFEFSLEYLSK
jgi:hypothetical protein